MTVISANDSDGNTPENDDLLPKKFKANWRLNQLSQPNPRLRNEKYEPPLYEFTTNVSPAALKATCSMRNDHISRPPIRLLEYNKRMYNFKGEKYVRRMNRKIEESWNSIYNYYKLQLREMGGKKKLKKHIMGAKGSSVSAKSSKRSVGSRASGKSKHSKKSKEEELKELTEWCTLRSQPKPPPPEPKINRGKRIQDLEAIKDHMTLISTPRQQIPKYDPEDEFWKDPSSKLVKEGALTYEPTERVLVLAKPNPLKAYEKPMEEPVVKTSALFYNISERVAALAIPRKKNKGPESDVKEDAFTISPAALKYVATPRILELARPTER